MLIETVAILSPGDMGHGVARDLVNRGFTAITCLAGRSDRTRQLAAQGGLRDVASLPEMVEEADLILSILPPTHAVGTAETVAAAMKDAGTARPYADCNAISPDTSMRIAAIMEAAGAPYIDGGIVGWNPVKSEVPTRVYVSGPDTGPMEALHGGGINIRPLGPVIGKASAMKMVYAAVTKGTWTLHTAALLAAEQHGLSEPFHAELKSSRPQDFAVMQRMLPRLPIDAGRWIGEMEEIAATLDAAGSVGDFHRGAAKIFGILDRTPFASETRETFDESRTLLDTLRETAKLLPKRSA